MPIASAGPLVLKTPISANTIAMKPTKIVPALLVIVSPTRPTVSAVARLTLW